MYSNQKRKLVYVYFFFICQPSKHLPVQMADVIDTYIFDTCDTSDKKLNGIFSRDKNLYIYLINHALSNGHYDFRLKN